jgi:hypothetical protein
MGEICSVCFEESGLLLISPVDEKMVCEDCLKRDELGVPRDRYSSGHSDDRCWAKVYGLTEDNAMAKAKRYIDRYPPQGYNTNISWQGWLTNENTGTKYYHVQLRRWHSCD